MLDNSLLISLKEEAETTRLGQCLANSLLQGTVCFFRGELGTGKTCIIRAFLRAHGVTGAIKSPSFALIEPYEGDSGSFFHIDLYRLTDPDELEAMGLRDYFRNDAICLIEWPEKGGRNLPSPDLDFHLEYQDSGRKVTITSKTVLGQDVLMALHSVFSGSSDKTKGE